MLSQVRDIRDCAFSAEDRLLIDTNVWLLNFGISTFGDSRVAVYSAGLKRMLEAKSQIFLNTTVLSEFCTQYANQQWRAEEGRRPKRFASKKEYRLSSAAPAAYAEIANLVSQIRKFTVWESLGCEATALDDIVAQFALGKADFNDLTVAALARTRGWAVVTDDADFGPLDLPLSTGNAALLEGG
ncbi:MAG: PIN domain-containing protein [Caldilineaceae bacterium]